MLIRKATLLSILTTFGCYGAEVDVSGTQSAITDVPHTDIERQSIGNCWLYAQATWVESMHLAAIQHEGPEPQPNTCEHTVCEAGPRLEAECSTCAVAICEADPYCCNTEWDQVCVNAVAERCGASACDAGEPPPAVEELDVSQSYWTYWHWFDQITGFMWDDEISTGGSQHVSNRIVLDRGLMHEPEFVPEDAQNEMSTRQSSALAAINRELKSGELADQSARRDGALVRRILDEAWGLSPEVRAQLDMAFGMDGRSTLRRGGSTEGTSIIQPSAIKARYAVRSNGNVQLQTRNLVNAINDWREARFPDSGDSAQRTLLERVQRALHDSQPVVVTWNVDFNALENADNGRRGSFNRQTLEESGGPGTQGGHMTVLEDYEVETEEFGVLPAGMTLDPMADAEMLAAALEASSSVRLLRTKNSWGSQRADRGFAPGFPGYHDLWMDYLAEPFRWCPSVEGQKTEENCSNTAVGLRTVMLPPGY